jgi:hypothetical protein
LAPRNRALGVGVTMNKRPRLNSLGPVLESALRATAIFAVLILVVRVAEVVLGRLVG